MPTANVVTYGHVSANAIHALAIKLRHAGTRSQRPHNVKKRFGVGWRRFNEGLTVLKLRGVPGAGAARAVAHLRHEPHHRSGGRRAVRRRWARRCSSSGPAWWPSSPWSNLSPQPVRPSKVAARLGIVADKDTVRALVQDARAGGHVAHHQDAISRGGCCRAPPSRLCGTPFFGTLPNVPENGVTENGVTENRVHITEESSSKQTESRDTIIHPTYPLASRGEGTRALQRGRDELAAARVEVQAARAGADHPGDWRASFAKARLEVSPPGQPSEQVTSPENWCHRLRLYGGAPAQVTTPEAYRQAPRSPTSCGGDRPGLEPLPPSMRPCMRWRAPSAPSTAGRKEIRSLGFIAVNLASRDTGQESGVGLQPATAPDAA